MITPSRDTICALATGPLPSAIAIVRLSGPDAFDVAASMATGGLAEHRIAKPVTLRAPDGTVLDHAIVTRFDGPRSYTGEDVVELSLHGGRAIVESILDVLLAHPRVRLAMPGEFTRRAFEAGKLDLTEAEAVADLIDADTPGQRDLALAQLGGALKQAYAQWREDFIACLALVDVSVDFPDEADAPDHTDGPVLERLASLKKDLTQALDNDDLGERIREGFRIVLVGAPNAGKSSVLNQLAGRDAAIVTDLPGTTRDTIDVRLRLAGHLAIVTDTAGLRESDDPVEREGIKRTHSASRKADLRVVVVDATAPMPEMTVDLSSSDIMLLNKIDQLSDTAPERIPGDVSRETLSVSAKTGEGIDQLIEALSSRLRNRVASTPAPLITRARHRLGLQNALHHLMAAEQAIESDAGAEFASDDIRRAVLELSALMGSIDVEDVLGAVFSEFCIGK